MNSLRGAKKQELGGIALNEFTLGNISRILENFQVLCKNYTNDIQYSLLFCELNVSTYSNKHYYNHICIWNWYIWRFSHKITSFSALGLPLFKVKSKEKNPKFRRGYTNLCKAKFSKNQCILHFQIMNEFW